jgi:hypothetical protein
MTSQELRYRFSINTTITIVQGVDFGYIVMVQE